MEKWAEDTSIHTTSMEPPDYTPHRPVEDLLKTTEALPLKKIDLSLLEGQSGTASIGTRMSRDPSAMEGDCCPLRQRLPYVLHLAWEATVLTCTGTITGAASLLK